MKSMKNIMALMLSVIMILAMGMTAFAQTVGTAAEDTATITINNAAKGETYKVYKLFDATVTGTKDGSIAYTGTIPDSLSSYFQADSQGNISLKEDVMLDETMQDALAAWAATATATASERSDGSVLKFVGLPYGYYIVTSTQEDAEQAKSLITVTSTNPDAVIYDKNATVPGPVDENTPVKTSDATNKDVNIGDTVTYTITFMTTNFNGAGADAKRIASYTITDTLPDFLEDVEVTEITIGNDAYTATDPEDSSKQIIPQFDDDGEITIPWVSGDATNGYTSLHNNGDVIKITYKATVGDKAAIAGAGNKNDVSITWLEVDATTLNEDDKITGSETIYTYAIAIQKINENATALSGATFQFPFYVKATADVTDGAYIYAGTTAPAEGDTSITNTITTPDSGLIIVKGVEAGNYSVTETEAPDGYNKLTAPETITAVKTTETTTKTTIYLDEDGDVTDTTTETNIEVTADIAASVLPIVNKTGTTLPSTGGMGTTALYVLGSLLVLGAGVALVVRRRMSAE